MGCGAPLDALGDFEVPRIAVTARRPAEEAEDSLERAQSMARAGSELALKMAELASRERIFAARDANGRAPSGWQAFMFNVPCSDHGLTLAPLNNHFKEEVLF